MKPLKIFLILLIGIHNFNSLSLANQNEKINPERVNHRFPLPINTIHVEETMGEVLAIRLQSEKESISIVTESAYFATQEINSRKIYWSQPLEGGFRPSCAEISITGEEFVLVKGKKELYLYHLFQSLGSHPYHKINKVADDNNEITCVALSPSNRSYVTTNSKFGKVQIHERKDIIQNKTLNSKNIKANLMKYSPNGAVLVCADNNFHFFHVDNDYDYNKFSDVSLGTINGLIFNNSAELLFAAKGENLIILELNHEKRFTVKLKDKIKFEKQINYLTLSTDQKYLYVIDIDSNLTIVDVLTLKNVANISLSFPSKIKDISFGKNNYLAIAIEQDIFIYDSKSIKLNDIKIQIPEPVIK